MKVRCTNCLFEESEQRGLQGNHTQSKIDLAGLDLCEIFDISTHGEGSTVQNLNDRNDHK